MHYEWNLSPLTHGCIIGIFEIQYVLENVDSVLATTRQISSVI